MQVFELPEPNFVPLSLAFSPDGRLVAGWAWGRVLVTDAGSGAARAVLGEWVAPGAVPGVGFTADGRAVVARGAKAWAQVHPLDPGGSARECPRDCGFALDVAHSGDVYLTHDRANRFQIRRWNPLTGKSAHGPHGVGYLRLLAVSADGRWVAGAGSGNVRVWNWGGGEPPARAARQFKEVSAPQTRALALSADGAFLALRGPAVLVGAVRDGKAWYVAGADWRDGRDGAFHPARPVLAYTGGGDEVVFYDAAGRTELKRFAWGIGPLLAVCFSADGLRCAAAGAGKVVVWDVDL